MIQPCIAKALGMCIQLYSDFSKARIFKFFYYLNFFSSPIDLA